MFKPGRLEGPRAPARSGRWIDGQPLTWLWLDREPEWKAGQSNQAYACGAQGAAKPAASWWIGAQNEGEVMTGVEEELKLIRQIVAGGGRKYTAGNIDRSRYDRLVDLGWLIPFKINISDVEYQVTDEGRAAAAAWSGRAWAEGEEEMTDEDETTSSGLIVATERLILKFLRDREAKAAAPPRNVHCQPSMQSSLNLGPFSRGIRLVTPW